MKYIEIGGQRVSVVGLGAWQFGSRAWGFGREYDAGDAQRVIHRAMELGINFIDTAELYGGGVSEHVVGSAVGDRRNEMFIASKVSPFHALRGSVVQAGERSLHFLNTEWIDLYQVHWPNPLVSIRSTMAGMRRLRQEGLIRHVGVSNFSLRRWREAETALGLPVLTNQVRYHLLDRQAERNLLPYAMANNRTIIAYSPLAQGMLTGKYSAERMPQGTGLPRTLFSQENLRRAQPIVDVLREVGKAHGATPAQVALAWVLSHPNVVVIPGAKSVAQVEENAAAAEITLRADELQALNAVSASFRQAGMWRRPAYVFSRIVWR